MYTVVNFAPICQILDAIRLKLEFHDADTDTDILADFLARK